jgi:hypothetical protein
VIDSIFSLSGAALIRIVRGSTYVMMAGLFLRIQH